METFFGMLHTIVFNQKNEENNKYINLRTFNNIHSNNNVDPIIKDINNLKMGELYGIPFILIENKSKNKKRSIFNIFSIFRSRNNTKKVTNTINNNINNGSNVNNESSVNNESNVNNGSNVNNEANIIVPKNIYFISNTGYLYDPKINVEDVVKDRNLYNNLRMFRDIDSQIVKNDIKKILNNKNFDLDQIIVNNKDNVKDNKGKMHKVLGYQIFNNELLLELDNDDLVNFNEVTPSRKIFEFKVGDDVVIKGTSDILKINNITETISGAKIYILSNGLYYKPEKLEKFNTFKTKSINTEKSESKSLTGKSGWLYGKKFKKGDKVLIKGESEGRNGMVAPYYIIEDIELKSIYLDSHASLSYLIKIGNKEVRKKRTGKVNLSNLIHYALEKGNTVQLINNTSNKERKITRVGKTILGYPKNEYYLNNNNKTAYKASDLKLFEKNTTEKNNKKNIPKNNSKDIPKNNLKDIPKNKAKDSNTFNVGKVVIYLQRKRKIEAISYGFFNPLTRKRVKYYKLSGIKDKVPENILEKAVAKKEERNRIKPIKRSQTTLEL